MIFIPLCRPQLFGADSIIEHLFDTYGPGYSDLPAALKGPGKSGGKGTVISYSEAWLDGFMLHYDASSSSIFIVIMILIDHITITNTLYDA